MGRTELRRCMSTELLASDKLGAGPLYCNSFKAEISSASSFCLPPPHLPLLKLWFFLHRNQMWSWPAHICPQTKSGSSASQTGEHFRPLKSCFCYVQPGSGACRHAPSLAQGYHRHQGWPVEWDRKIRMLFCWRRLTFGSLLSVIFKYMPSTWSEGKGRRKKMVWLGEVSHPIWSISILGGLGDQSAGSPPAPPPDVIESVVVKNSEGAGALSEWKVFPGKMTY